MSKKRKLQHRAAFNGNPKSATRHKSAPGKPNKKPRANPSNTPSSTPSSGAKKSSASSHNNESDATPDQRPTIPFAPSDRILLVGEGDLSFAASLVSHHGCTAVTATVLERDLAELRDKYPHVEQNVAAVLAGGPGCRVLYGVDARKLGPLGKVRRKSGGGGGGGHDAGNTSQDRLVSKPTTGSKHERKDDPDSESDSDTAESPLRKRSDVPKPPNQPKPRDEQPKNSHLMDRIIFNFPHVGGKSTDVNRQVRHNQELLVSFFRRAEPLLVSPGGSIIVTLFESEPYTLWNVRDLARHCGLRVARSFRFQAGAYPGYRHARTLGALRDRATGEVTEGAWSGERRASRSYVFVRGGEEEEVVAVRMGGPKRRREDDDHDDLDEYYLEEGDDDEGSEDNDSD